MLGSFGVNGLDKDSIRYTRQYGVLPDDTVPADIIQLPNGSVLTPVTGGASTVNNQSSKVIDNFLNNYRNINGLDANYLRDPNHINKLANVGTYQIGIDHMTYNFTISGAGDEKSVMNAISKNIDTIAKDVGAKIGREVSKMGLKGNYLY